MVPTSVVFLVGPEFPVLRSAKRSILLSELRSPGLLSQGKPDSDGVDLERVSSALPPASGEPAFTSCQSFLAALISSFLTLQL